MKKTTFLKLQAIHAECDELDKSTEYMMARMLEVTNQNMDIVHEYLLEVSECNE